MSRRRESMLLLFAWLSGAFVLAGGSPTAQLGTVRAEQKISETAGRLRR